jgi:hypothetical protein
MNVTFEPERSDLGEHSMRLLVNQRQFLFPAGARRTQVYDECNLLLVDQRVFASGGRRLTAEHLHLHVVEPQHTVGRFEVQTITQPVMPRQQGSAKNNRREINLDGNFRNLAIHIGVARVMKLTELTQIAVYLPKAVSSTIHAK